MRVDVKPDMLRWAIERAGMSTGDLRKKFPKIVQWAKGEVKLSRGILNVPFSGK